MSAQYLPGRYRDVRITTASQPELQLMLLEGALRYARLAAQTVDSTSIEYQRHVSRAVDIVEELVRSVSGAATEVSVRLGEEYAYAFRSLAAAKLSGDVASLAQAIDILAFHRETWKLACEKLRQQTGERSDVGAPDADQSTSGRAAIPLAPHFPLESGVASGLSLEA